MPEYGQFCPVAKASDIIGERWTVLILRELLLGTTRYNDFQRGARLGYTAIQQPRCRRLGPFLRVHARTR